MKLFEQLKNKLKDDKKKRLLENYLSLSVLQGLNYLLPLITLPYLVRILGAEKYGLVMFAQAFTQFFIIFTDYGFNLSAAREIAVHRNDRDMVSTIYWSVMIIKGVFIVTGFGVMAAIVFYFDRFKPDWILYLLCYGMVLGQACMTPWFFQGMERMKFITLINITARVIFTVTIFIVVRQQTDYIYVPLLSSTGMILAGAMSMMIALKRFKVAVRIPGFKALSYHLRSSFQFFLSQVSVSFYTYANSFALGLFVSNQAVAYYAAAQQLYKAMYGVFVPLVNALYPFISKERSVGLFKKVYWPACGAAALGGLFVFVFSGPITDIIFGAGFGETSHLLQLFSVLVVIAVASVLLGYPFLAALGHPEYANMSVVFGSILHLAILAAIIPVMTTYLVAIATIVTELTILLIRIHGVRKLRLWKKPDGYIAPAG